MTENQLIKVKNANKITDNYLRNYLKGKVNFFHHQKRRIVRLEETFRSSGQV